MSKIAISTSKRTSPKKSGNFKPIFMLNSLALIFAINSLLSWLECTFGSPTHRNYLQYYAFTNHFKPKFVIIVGILLTIIAVVSHLLKIWQSDAYLSYFVLFYDIIAITYWLSGHYTSTNKLSLGNLIVALCFYGLALCHYFAHQMEPKPKIIVAFWFILTVISGILAYMLKVGWLAFILYALITNVICSMSYMANSTIESYIRRQASKKSLLAANLQAIFHLPWSLTGRN